VADLRAIVRFLDAELQSAEVPDYDAALNGLQLANAGDVTRVAAAVDFSAQSVRAAVEAGADLMVVHHGMFWRGAQQLTGHLYERLRDAIANNLAIYSSHIPLDVHPKFGNNALLAGELGLSTDGSFGRYRGIEIGVTGASSISTGAIHDRLDAFAKQYDSKVVCTPFDQGRQTKRWAIITGAGASTDSLHEAVERGVDTFIVGEGAHHTAVLAMELGVTVMYAGHYATETIGVRALAAEIAARYTVPWTFVHVPTGL